ncbi:MAG: urease accessory protein UreF, partial [Alphaproteobacteria bacterium]
MAIITTITEKRAGAAQQALYRLLTWLSPAYPVGAYTYSHGLEAAVEAGSVAKRD